MTNQRPDSTSDSVEQLLGEIQRLKRALHSTIAAIIVVDKHFHITFANKSVYNIFQFEYTEFFDKSLQDLFLPKKWNEYVTTIFNAEQLQTDEIVTELEVVKKDGSVCWLFARVLMQFDADNQFDGYVIAAHDITLQKQQEVELRSRTKELEQTNRLMVGREIRMKELKKEMNTLKNSVSKKNNT